MKRVDLQEYEVTPPLDLTADDVKALQAHGAVDVLPSLLEQQPRWQLRGRQYVGVVRAGDLEARIHPKLPISRLLFLLAYSTDPDGWLDTVADLGAAEDLIITIGHAFAYHAERAITPGILQGYVTREESLLALRGRLREGDQLRRQLGLPVPLEVSYDDFSPDIPENQLLRSGAELLLRVPLPLAIRSRIGRLHRVLGDVSVLTPGIDPPQLTITRLNRRYRAATILASLILQRRSIEFRTPDLPGAAFLFDMNRVFEDFVTAALGRALHAKRGRVQGQYRTHLDEARRIPIRPDVTWWDGRSCLAVVDAKYKAASSDQIPNPDVYQVFAYCTALGLRVGHLVYPSGEEAPAVHAIRNADIEVHVHSVPLAESPGGVLAAVGNIADRIAATRGTRTLAVSA